MLLWLLPVLVPSIRDALSRPVDMPLVAHLAHAGKSTCRQLLRAVDDYSGGSSHGHGDHGDDCGSDGGDGSE